MLLLVRYSSSEEMGSCSTHFKTTEQFVAIRPAKFEALVIK